MPKRKRIQREHTEDWPTIKQYTLWPEQAAYELLRPIVLFGDPAIGRAEETGEAKSTLDRKADAFEESGMVSLFATKPRKQSIDSARSLPPDMRQLIVDLRVELPSLSLREIAEICDVLRWRIHLSFAGLEESPFMCCKKRVWGSLVCPTYRTVFSKGSIRA